MLAVSLPAGHVHRQLASTIMMPTVDVICWAGTSLCTCQSREAGMPTVHGIKVGELNMQGRYPWGGSCHVQVARGAVWVTS